MDLVRETPDEDITAEYPLPDKVPTHVAVIMDGNGRWARQRGLPRIAGHRAGTENLREILRACVSLASKPHHLRLFDRELGAAPKKKSRVDVHPA